MFPPNRQLKQLSDVSVIIRWLTYKPEQVKKISNWIACFRTKNVQNFLDESDIIYIDPILVKSEEKLLKTGDILVSSANSVELLWKCCLIENLNYDATLWWFICALRPQKSIIEYKYLYYIFNSENTQKKLRSFANKTTGIANLPIPKMMDEILIPLPPLAVQHKIVAALDEALVQITESKSVIQFQLDVLDQLWQSSLSQVFENIEAKKVNLWDIVKIIGGWTPSKNNKSYYENGTIPRASVRDMKEDEIKTTELSITEEWLKNSSSNIVSKEWIIIATRVWLGKVCYINKDTAINQDLKWLIPKQWLQKDFLFWFMKSIANIIISQWTWATVQWVKLDFIKQIQIPLPPLTTQTQIVSQLDNLHQNITSLKAQYKAQLQHFDNLRASILDKAFKGELVEE